MLVILFHHSRLKWILQYFKLHVYEMFNKGMDTTRAENVQILFCYFHCLLCFSVVFLMGTKISQSVPELQAQYGAYNSFVM